MKERLVGAVVLVGLIVALVPEMLSGPRRPAADSRASHDGAVRVHTIDLAPPTTPPESPQPDPAQPLTQATDAPTDAATARDAPAIEGSTAGKPPRGAPAEAPARGGAEPALASGWAVQLGSFASQENAERLAAQVRKSGYRAFVSRYESNSRVRYRVRVGPEQDRAQADSLARRLERDGRQVSVVSHP